MTELWARVPTWLAMDAGVLKLPSAAQVSLYRIAMNGGAQVSCGQDPVGALDALCAGAGASLGEMVDIGAIQVAGGRIYLMAPDGLPSAVGATQAPRAGVPSPRIGDASGEGVGELLRAAQRHLGALWSKAGARTLDARCAWLDTPAGERAIKRERITREQAVEIAARAGANAGRFGTRPAVSTTASTVDRVDTVAVSTTASTALPSQTLPSEKEQENKAESETRAASTRGVNFRGVDSATVSTTAVSTGATASTVETTGAKIHPDSILDAMGGASGHLVSTAGIASEKVAFGVGVRELLASGATLDAVVASAAHLKHGHWTQRQRRTALSAARLVAPGHNGKPSILTELLVESETCAECQRARAPRAEVAPEAPPVPIEKLTGDEVRAIRAAARATAEAKRKETAHVRD